MLTPTDESGDYPFSKILLLRIAPRSEADTGEIAKVSPIAASFRGLTGPLEALASVRSSSQSERSRLESLLIERYGGRVEANAKNEPQGSEDFTNNFPNESYNKTQRFWGQSKARENIAKRRISNRSQIAAEVTGQRIVQPSKAPVEGVEKQLLLNQVEDHRVVVLEILFDLESDDSIIPLNWKLNEMQKKMYSSAWTMAKENQTEEFGILDQLFLKAGRSHSVHE